MNETVVSGDSIVKVFDITFQVTDESDGGILIRGVKVGKDYVNGPRKIITKIFEVFGKVTSENKLQLVDSENRNKEIIKTFRHLPNKVTYPEFHDKYYRYITYLDDVDITESQKDLIREKSEKL